MSSYRLKRRFCYGVFILCTLSSCFLISYAFWQQSMNSWKSKYIELEENFTEQMLVQILENLSDDQHMHSGKRRELIESITQWQVEQDRLRPVIFVGGVPRSGTTLMRVLLDAHPNISCGQETRIIPRILKMYSNWGKTDKEAERLNEASLTKDSLNRVMSAMLMQIFREQIETVSEFFCNKDPFNLAHIHDLDNIFPNSKFVLMIRDGRAVTHSIVDRGVTISGLDIESYEKVLQFWNSACEGMLKECTQINRKHQDNRCIKVFYENLILNTETELKRVFEFLAIPWDSRILHHEQMVGNGDIKLSRLEPSTKQVSQAIYNESLSKWKSQIPSNVLTQARQLAPLLAKLGYA